MLDSGIAPLVWKEGVRGVLGGPHHASHAYVAACIIGCLTRVWRPFFQAIRSFQQGGMSTVLML
jgi:hypothetical protein